MNPQSFSVYRPVEWPGVGGMFFRQHLLQDVAAVLQLFPQSSMFCVWVWNVPCFKVALGRSGCSARAFRPHPFFWKEQQRVFTPLEIFRLCQTTMQTNTNVVQVNKKKTKEKKKKICNLLEVPGLRWQKPLIEVAQIIFVLSCVTPDPSANIFSGEKTWLKWH